MTASPERTRRRTTPRVVATLVGVVALVVGASSTAQAAATDWTTTGTAHTRSVTEDGSDILLNYNNNGFGRFSTTATYSTVATTTGADAVDYSWGACHSWYMAHGTLTFFADGPAGRASQTVYNSYFGCGQTVAGQVTLDLTQGYTWGVTVSGSHFDSSYILSGTVRLIGENALADGDGDGVADAADNCAGTANADQVDTDGDAAGDACDTDDDDDGTLDEDDSFPTDPTRDGDEDDDGIKDTAPPTSKDQCKKGGWASFNNPSFRNQGQCVSFVVSNRP